VPFIINVMKIMLLATKRNLIKMTMACRKKDYSFILTEYSSVKI